MQSVPLQPAQIANGAKSLLDEVAASKITGEEDRYSHTDLWDFQANVDGAKAAIVAVTPILAKGDPELLSEIRQRFTRGRPVARSVPRRAPATCSTPS